MDRVRVRSSNLASVGYDAEEGILEIVFLNGRIYEYYRVPEDVFQGLVSASSPGQYFADHVRDRYRFRPIQ
jgi:hypothetical protein